MPGDDDLAIPGVGATGPAAAADPSAPAGAVAATDAAGSSEVDAITSALADGSIDAVEARTRLIECAVSEQLPAGASDEVIQAVRAEVEALLADDPTLDALLAPG